jgi:hypothetical protein
MPMHERKVCPRCNAVFECKAGNITDCQCNAITLTMEERAFVEMRFADCLCAQCLLQLKDRYVFFKEKYFLIPK